MPRVVIVLDSQLTETLFLELRPHALREVRDADLKAHAVGVPCGETSSKLACEVKLTLCSKQQAARSKQQGPCLMSFFSFLTAVASTDSTMRKSKIIVETCYQIHHI